MAGNFEVIPPNTGYLHHYPAVGFHFRVTFMEYKPETEKDEDVKYKPDDCDARFQSVSGLSVELETENKKEGGENRFEHVLPLRAKFPLLVLKRGLIKGESLRLWIRNNIDSISHMASVKPAKRLITPKNILIDLLGPDDDKILMSWKIFHAWPKKWSVSDLNAEQNSILIESMEFQYQYFTLNDKINAD